MIKQILLNKIFKNFSVLTLTNITIQLLSIITSIRIARLLQPENYGYYNLIMVEAGLFSIIAVFGLRWYTVRYVARSRSESRHVFFISNNIRLVTTTLAIIGIVVYNLFLSKTQFSSAILFMLSIYIVFQSFWDSIESIAFGNERMESSGYINLIFTFIWVVIVYFIPKNHFNVEVLFGIFVLVNLFKTLVYYLWLNRKILSKNPSDVKSDANYKLFVGQSSYYFILAVFSALVSQVPIILLSYNSTIDQVGIFNLGNRILTPMRMVLSTALVSIYPSLSRIALESKEIFSQRIKVFINLTIMIGLWVAISFTLFGREVVLILYGRAYLDSARVILIQIWFTLIYSIFSIIGTVLSSFDRQKTLAILSVIYGTLALPVFYLGAEYGAIGLAWAYVIAAYLHMTYHWLVFKKLLSPYLTFGYTFKLFSIMIIATVSSAFIPFEYGLSIRIIVGIIITVAFFYYFKNNMLKKVLLLTQNDS